VLLALGLGVGLSSDAQSFGCKTTTMRNDLLSSEMSSITALGAHMLQALVGLLLVAIQVTGVELIVRAKNKAPPQGIEPWPHG
jgi:hypothetical protein